MKETLMCTDFFFFKSCALIMIRKDLVHSPVLYLGFSLMHKQNLQWGICVWHPHLGSCCLFFIPLMCGSPDCPILIVDSSVVLIVFFVALPRWPKPGPGIETGWCVGQAGWISSLIYIYVCVYIYRYGICNLFYWLLGAHVGLVTTVHTVYCDTAYDTEEVWWWWVILHQFLFC